MSAGLTSLACTAPSTAARKSKMQPTPSARSPALPMALLQQHVQQLMAQGEELWILARDDLVARAPEARRQALDHGGRPRGQHGDAVGEEHRFIDVVRDQHRGKALLLPEI